MKTYKVTVDNNNTICWYNEYGESHRECGPAVVESWQGKVTCRFWFISGKLHREDGPATEYSDGCENWYLGGEWIAEEEFNKRMNPESCEGLEVVIDGITYVLLENKKQ